VDGNGTSNFHGTRYTLSLSQSLFDFGKFWSWRRSQKVIGRATAEHKEILNSLMFDVVERYFSVLEAVDQLKLVYQNKEMIQKQLEQVKKRYAKQLLKVTDVYEIEARLDAIVADKIEAENILAVAKENLTELITDIDYNRGILDGISKLFNKEDILNIEINTLTDEAINTSLIEGEVFKRESVRSSYAEALAAKSLLSSFEEVKDREFLSGMGSGIFLISKLSDKDKVMVSLGKNIVAKLTVKEASKYLDNKIKMLNEAMDILQARLNEIAQEMLKLRSKIEALYRSV
jgi:prefoldin alpha subunit